MVSIALSEKINDKGKTEFTKIEKDKINSYSELTEKFSKINARDYQDYGDIKIIYVDVDKEELKIITTSNHFEKMKK